MFDYSEIEIFIAFVIIIFAALIATLNCWSKRRAEAKHLNTIFQVKSIYRIGAPRNVDYGTLAKISTEEGSIDSSRHENNV